MARYGQTSGAKSLVQHTKKDYSNENKPSQNTIIHQSQPNKINVASNEFTSTTTDLLTDIEDNILSHPQGNKQQIHEKAAELGINLDDLKKQYRNDNTDPEINNYDGVLENINKSDEEMTRNHINKNTYGEIT